MKPLEMRPPSILSIGDVVVDLIASVSFPIGPDQVIMSGQPRLEAGGACNFAITAARLGLDCKVIGAPGADLFGNWVIDILKSENVDTTLIKQFASLPTTLVVVLSDPAALRQTYISAPLSGSDIYPFDEAVRAALKIVDALYFQGYTLCEDSLWEVTRHVLIEAAGKLPIYFDPSPLLINAPIERRQFALEYADVILATEDEMPLLVPDLSDRRSDTQQISAALLAGHADLLVIKRNVNGCRIVTEQGEQDFPAYPVKAISAVAAGDAFNAGFIAARLHDFSVEDAARVANATGAAKVQRSGGGRNVPHLADISLVLENNGINLSFDDWH